MKLLIHSHLASWELGNCCQWISNFIPHFLCWACKYLSTRGLKLFLVSKRASSDPFYSHGLTWIPAWISNHMPSIVWDEITYPLINFNGTIVEVKEWIRNLLVGFYLWDYKMALSDAATGPKVNSKSWFNIITPEAYEGIWKANSLLLHWLQWPGTKALSAFHPAGCVCTDGWDGWDYFRARSSAPLTLSFHDMLLLTLWSWQNTQLNIVTNIINKKKVDMHTFTGIMNFRFFSIHFDARNE